MTAPGIRVRLAGDELLYSRGRLLAASVDDAKVSSLNAFDEAEAFAATLLADETASQAGIARRIGRSQSYVSNALRTRRLPASVRALVATGRLTGSHAKLLASTAAAGRRVALATRAVEEGWSTRRLDAETSGREAPSPSPTPRTPSSTGVAPAVVEELLERVDSLEERLASLVALVKRIDRESPVSHRRIVDGGEGARRQRRRGRR